jgi:hypothetical protein
MQKEINFASSDERYAVELPDALGPVPTCYSTIEYQGGTRQVLYEPQSRAIDPRRYGHVKLLDTRRRGDFEVDISITKDEPAHVMATWRLPEGLLMTFLNDDQECGADLVGGINDVIDHVDVRIATTGLPVVELREPLAPGSIREPLYREALSYYPREGEQWWPRISIRREPPWAREGRSKTKSGETAEVTVTNVMQIAVCAAGPAAASDELERHAERVARSVAPR